MNNNQKSFSRNALLDLRVAESHTEVTSHNRRLEAVYQRQVVNDKKRSIF